MTKPVFRFALLCVILLLLLVVGGSLAYLSDKSDSGRRNAIAARVESLKKEIAGVKNERAALEQKIVEAQDLEAWVLSSMPIRPLFVDIVRSMGPQSEIVELSIERDAETPSQLRLNLKLNTASDAQLEETIAVIAKRNYREFNQTQARVQGNIEYTASLLWQNPNADKLPAPEERIKAALTVP
jgi:predicted ribosomally synthesized peptide with SipW-like signal peptide